MSKEEKAEKKEEAAVVEEVGTGRRVIPLGRGKVMKREVTLQCPDPDCGRTWSSSQGEYCPKCLAHGRQVKGIEVS